MNQGMMNGNNGNIFPQYPQQNQSVQIKKSSVEYLFYACLALVIVGCFLPFVTNTVIGVSATSNFVYYDNELLQGAYVVILAIAAFSSVFIKQNYKAPLGLLAIALSITIYNYIDVKNTFEEQLTKYSYMKDYISQDFGIGFYIVLIGLISAIIVNIILVNKNKNVQPIISTIIPQPMMNGQNNNNVMYNQSMGGQFVQPLIQQKCQYCGSNKNVGNYCNSCGGQY